MLELRRWRALLPHLSSPGWGVETISYLWSTVFLCPLGTHFSSSLSWYFTAPVDFLEMPHVCCVIPPNPRNKLRKDEPTEPMYATKTHSIVNTLLNYVLLLGFFLVTSLHVYTQLMLHDIRIMIFWGSIVILFCLQDTCHGLWRPHNLEYLRWSCSLSSDSPLHRVFGI